MSFFHQCMSPVHFGVALMALALTLPSVLYRSPSARWLNNRLVTLQVWIIKRITQHLLVPSKPGGHMWASLITSVMFFVITLDMVGLLPSTITATMQHSLSLALAVRLWLGIGIMGMRNQRTHGLGDLLPEGSPSLLMPLRIIIVTISLFLRPLGLGDRLMANLTAGLLHIQLLGTPALVLFRLMPTVAMLTSILLFLVTLLEVAVALILAYVYVVQLSFYLEVNV
uniref:ATP synthase subunit a n=1 Tax=Selaroides leptolepis TaxID=173311 RepID=A0A120L101_SELLE|nr:ATP synthase F0 subunit 6 [Selaroides leptolepis]